MRLSDEQRQALRAKVVEEVGADCDVLLFGSRVDDSRRGGDVDILVRSPRLIADGVWTAARLAARLERLLGGRHVDVVLMDPATTLTPFHAAALAESLPL